MKSVHFGFGLTCAPTGSTPSVALNRHGTVLLAHQAANGTKRYRVGRLNQASIDWGASKPAGSGETPRVALNAHDIAVEVHRNPDHKVLYCRVGRLEGAGSDRIAWPYARRYAEGANRIRPVVAMNDDGLVIEEHEVHEGRRIWMEYAVGQIKESGRELYVEWSPRIRRGEATMPAVAINNRGIVVQIHRYPYGSRDRRFFYHVGHVRGTTIEFNERKEIVLPNGVTANGHYPSVAITDDGFVVVVLRARTKVEVLELVGEVNAAGDAITWHRWWFYDWGTRPSVAAAGTMAVEVHERGSEEVVFSTSIITDRSSWMADRLDVLGDKPLRELVLPASHDAGMYTSLIPRIPFNLNPALNQSLTIYDQLQYGVRYFDLRPMWAQYHEDSPRRRWVIHHGRVVGPALVHVLRDVEKFAAENHRELVILKLSHFQDVDDDSYRNLVQLIEDEIGDRLVRSRPNNKRLADITLNEYVRNGTAVLVVVDRDFPVNYRREGFWVYRNWFATADAARQGDLSVYDRFSNTNNFERMRNGQRRKFEHYNGRMQNAPELPCDLFLLSWTLTPKPPALPISPWLLARQSSQWLGQDNRIGYPPPAIPNAHGKIINLLYVDYVETARVTDVALFHNGERGGSEDPRN